MTRTGVFYLIKPALPRSLQIGLRCLFAKRKRCRCSDIWPIDPKACSKPPGWSGWPEGKRFAVGLTHDVDTEQGLRQCRDLIDLEMSLGFRSSFNFVPERYSVPQELRAELLRKGFEVGVHGLKHDGKLYRSRKEFHERALKINRYLQEWGAVGFRSPAMHHNLAWLHELNMKYDASTFDTDPFEPQSDGVQTIFPFWVTGSNGYGGYVELPYTLPQDFTLFVLMKEKDISIWQKKVDWVADHGGMVLVIVHPDYLDFDNSGYTSRYPADNYRDLLHYVKNKYAGQYWHALPREISDFYSAECVSECRADSTENDPNTELLTHSKATGIVQ